MPHRFRNQLKFELERFLVRGPFHRLLVVALGIVLISLAGGLLVFTVSGGFADAGDAIWWAFLRLSDPGYLGDDVGTFRRTVSTALTILGYVVFLGALVAIMTQWLNHRLAELQRGLTPIAQSNHVVIVGWTTRTGMIVRELLASEGRVQRFLERSGARRLRIVLLVEEVTPALVQELREVTGEHWDPRAVILRSGSAIRAEHLRRADYLNAAVVIVPADESDVSPDALVSRDARAVKVLLSAGGGDPNARRNGDGALPFVVVELAEAAKTRVARRAYPGALEIVAGDVVIARLLAETILHPGLSHVYGELFTHDVGNELYVRDAQGWGGLAWSCTLEAFPHGVPLGVVRREAEGFRPILDPPDSLVLRDDDRFVVLAERLADAAPLAADRVRRSSDADAASPDAAGVDEPRRGVPGTAPAGAVVPDAPTREAGPARPGRERRVLLLGWNHKAAPLLEELDGQGVRTRVDVLSLRPPADRTLDLEAFGVRGEHLHIHHLEGDYTRLEELADAAPREQDVIVFLSSDRIEAGAESDARSVMGYLVLQELLGGTGREPQVLLELLDPENVRLLPRRGDERLVSPVVLGHMLTQVALRPELRVVFDELFGPGETEVRFHRAAELGVAGRQLTFTEIARAARTAGELVIGVRVAAWRGGERGGVRLNPGWHSRWELSEEDDLVVVGRR